MWIGSGPYTIPVGNQTMVGFAVAAGASLQDLQAHADSARTAWDAGLLSDVPEETHVGAYVLCQNYPNPFNPSTAIRYGLPQRAQVTLTVFNTLGQLVATLVQGEQEAGYHETKFDGTGLSSGVYFYRLRARQIDDGQAGEFVLTRKLLLLH